MKILYIASLNTKKNKYDGERIKSTNIFNVINHMYDVTVVNLSRNKMLQMLKFIFYILFREKNYNYVFVSKDPHGANIIHKLLLLCGFPMDKVIYFEIGPFLYDRIINKSINIKTFLKDKMIVVETDSMKKELESLGFNNIDIFPNFKKVYDIKEYGPCYPKKVLKLLYLSRIEEKKGIFDLIDVVKKANSGAMKFQLDIYGMTQSKKDYCRLKKSIKESPFINYLGKLEINNEDSYYQISKYDLHVFPTKYSEGFPGTLIDCFIAGLPTISSSFARAKDIFAYEDSILYEQGNNEDMFNKLIFVYENQPILPFMRKKTYERRNMYSTTSFESYLSSLFGE